MPRVRSEDRDKAFKIYKDQDGNIDLVDIAKSLNIPPGTIRGWKNKDKWEQQLNGTFQKDTERSKRKKGGQPNNKNATGPPENKHAESHGFFSKYLPADTFAIIQEIEIKNNIDILWENIQIQYAAIVRAQGIMHVKDQMDLTKELKREKESSGDTSDSWEKEYELQFAWDKQATFLTAQSRAMKTLESMIKQYDELLRSELATEEQKARIAVLKAKANLDDNCPTEDDGFIEALSGKVDVIWQDE